MRLDDRIRPIRYEIRIEPDFDTFTFSGEETISIDMQCQSDEVVLNSRELKINGAWLVSGKTRKSLLISTPPDEEAVHILLGKRMSGKLELFITFTGTNNDGMYGFYRCRYGDSKDHRDSYVLSSQFEPADARAAFPCFDEPAFKAVFSLTLAVDDGMRAISNMPSVRIRGIPGTKKKEVLFEPTPPMSSYLLYLGVGKFDAVTGRYGNLRIRVMTTPGNSALGELSLEYTKHFLAFYESYFGIKYPLPKLDLLAIPDFAAGAMENWGAITFRSQDLLGDSESSVAIRKRIAETVAHELAHQWFGDLVTMDWWNDIWLNESFATLMSYKAVHSAFPEFKMDRTFFEDEVSEAFGADDLRSTHPIYVKIASTAEISSVFDSISYSKGASILHMLEDYIGAETFRKGLHTYLKAHSFGNASKEDLWLALDAQARKESKRTEVKRVAESWITNPGYPIVGLSGNKISQGRFLLSGITKSEGNWPIPIHYATSEGKEGFVLFKDRSALLGAVGTRWTKLNYGQAGFYRSRYSESAFEELGKAVRSGELGDIDAWGIGIDAFALTRNGTSPLEWYAHFIEDYMLGSGYPYGIELFRHLEFIHLMSYGTPIEHRVMGLKEKYAHSVIKRVGISSVKGEQPTVRTMRAAAFTVLGEAKYFPVLSKSKKLFADALQGKRIDRDLARPAYATIVRNGGPEEFQSMLGLYRRTLLPEEKIDVLVSLGKFKNPKIVLDALRFALSKEVRIQDTYVIPYVAAGTPIGRPIVLSWTFSNWKRLVSIYAPGTHMLNRYVENLAAQNTRPARDRIRRFFGQKGNQRDDIRRGVEQTLERIDANISFMRKNFGKV